MESLLLSAAADSFGKEEEEQLLQVEVEASPLLRAADFFGKEEEGQLLQVETARLVPLA